MHWMILPSLACPAHCAYCFGPNHGPRMSQAVFDAGLEWMAASTPAQGPVAITFHGGEPLAAGYTWFAYALPRLQAAFGSRLRLGIQSNLWLLDLELIELFKHYHVQLSTSLDGPRRINDLARGAGYFDRTLRGIDLARLNGLHPGVICTFTRQSAPSYAQILEFFISENLPFSIHAALPRPGLPADPVSLSPGQYADLMIALFDAYQPHLGAFRITTFDLLLRSLACQSGGICAFGECLGSYLALAPGGEIYTCNRFVGHPEWSIGNVLPREHPRQPPGLPELALSPAWQRLQERQRAADAACTGCPYHAVCRGGCPFAAYFSPSAPTGDPRDPLCPAYQRIFAHLTDRALEQVFSPANLASVIQSGTAARGLLHQGPLLAALRGAPRHL